MIDLRKIWITDDNMKECIALEVIEEQRKFVASNAMSLADAFDWNKDGESVTPYAIYADGNMVGFVMYCFVRQEYEDTYGEDCYFFWRFMMDKAHQGKGYGREALKMILDEIRQMPNGKAEHCYTSYEPANVVAKKLYEDFGFAETGQVDDGELVARLKL
ncbi:MAG: GNAT family N-acetyltransferase [Defluviitaleaceae bacterium]|nr:GNAT family N-acetyltransferase [Defluviitaleaceae bacterium]